MVSSIIDDGMEVNEGFKKSAKKLIVGEDEKNNISEEIKSLVGTMLSQVEYLTGKTVKL